MIKTFLKDNHISSSEDLLLWMSDNIEYGFVGSDRKRYTEIDFDDTKTPIDFYHKYRLQSPKQLIDSKLGVCWDCAELERACFKEMGYQFDIYYLELMDKVTSTHTFLTYWHKSKLYWFESSYFDKRGIHGPYRSRVEIFEELHLSLNKEDSAVGITAYTLSTIPKYGSSCRQYMSVVKAHKPIWEVIVPIID